MSQAPKKHFLCGNLLKTMFLVASLYIYPWEDLFLNDLFLCLLSKNVFLDTYCSVIWINWYVIFMQLEEITWFHSFRNFKLICNLYRRLFELSESLNVLSDNNFHLKNCMNIQFHWYYYLKYKFVCKYMEKITMENLDEIWTVYKRKDCPGQLRSP